MSTSYTDNYLQFKHGLVKVIRDSDDPLRALKKAKADVGIEDSRVSDGMDMHVVNDVAPFVPDLNMEIVGQDMGQGLGNPLHKNVNIASGNVKSYAATLVGDDTSNRPPFQDLTDKVVIQDDHVVINRSIAYPVIQFSNRVHDSIDYNMRKSVIVRLLGKSIVYRVLWHKINILWQPRERFQLIELDNEYFLVRFELENDYTEILIEGPDRGILTEGPDRV
ncbi:hypothetical protein F3Y22_tig00110450pilonHSYRG00866 [Hibiscus syriacus]|uniref:DUF4283 domain-containing protein n=1 Tax=Hibiscus syriacus TaxID=106335 RepID=A0A6A3ANZ3_HIBSY|nr:hypothetical protein F3Y22_tig00110450pilonHSYRG00866 [Hibiscus syriacus]